ncbi:MAG TPA: S1C family serine protease [Gemmatimonadaceae bacterium]|nr:S1C family serine protease [Gemmatimonadaceae bacterium]
MSPIHKARMSAQRSGSSSTLSELSSQLATAVETAGNSIVAIHARRRIPSSGILWRDGIIVSASHTVRREDEIPVTLPNGDSTIAKIAGRDSATDVIALRIEGGGAKLQAAPRADPSSLRIGSLILAVGRPGRNVSASFGIVSAVGEGWRTWQGARIDRVLRLDLAVYDGFSGGSLVDASGAVLGLNNSALARGTPMALPATAVDRVLDELLERGHVRRPFIGVAVQPVALSASLLKQHQLPNDTGLLVVSIAESSPADNAGMLLGDVLLEANGQALAGPDDLLDALSSVSNGGGVTLKFLRGGVVKSASVTPADRGGQE